MIAIFLMRFSGQGLMSHTSSTTISGILTKEDALCAIWFGYLLQNLFHHFNYIFTFHFFMEDYMAVYINYYIDNFALNFLHNKTITITQERLQFDESKKSLRI